MIKKTFLLRLVLDFFTAGLLLVALAYYWQGNAAHEWIGTGIFVLLMAHNVFNRRWYGNISSKPRRETRSRIDIVLTLCLLAAMLVLLISSVMISQNVFSFLQMDGGFTVRQIHMLAAYWSLVFVAIHVGMRWQRVMNTVRSVFHISGKSRLRTFVLRLMAAALALYGLQASFVMAVDSKLSLQMSLDGWDFDAAAPAFFINWTVIMGLYAVLTHYVLAWLQQRKRRADATNLGVEKT